MGEQQKISLDALANNGKRSISALIDQFFDIIVAQQKEIDDLKNKLSELEKPKDAQ